MKRIIPLLSLVLFFSCENPFDNVSVSGTGIQSFYANQTTQIKIAECIYEKDYPLDNKKNLCVPSNEDLVITYKIQNPQGLPVFIQNYSNASDSLLNEIPADEIPESVYKISEIKNNTFTLALTKEFLTLVEKNESGADITPSFLLGLPDEYNASFEEYKNPLVVNTPPPQVQAAVIMLDKGYASSGFQETLGRYVLCFNLPDSMFKQKGTDVHSDVKTIKITGLSGAPGVKFERGVDLNISYDDAAGKWTMNSSLNTVRPDLLSKNEYNNEMTGNGLPAVEFFESNHPVYITDSKNASYGDDCTYKITLIDEKGLSSSVTVLSNSRQLKPVIINVDDGQIVPFVDSETNERYFTLVLTAPKETEGTAYSEVDDVTIHYNLYEVNPGLSNNTLIETGEAKTLKNFNLKDGGYYLETYASKDGYVDSVYERRIFYVGNRLENGVEIELPEKYVMYMALSSLNFNRATLEQNHTLSLSLQVVDNKGNTLPPETSDISEIKFILQDKNSTYELESGESPYEVELPQFLRDVEEEAKYNVIVKVTYRENTYSQTFELSVE